ncbi:MAG: hypothetical protein RJA63_2857 [Pseudomonadota bacterium]|jgi:hypothetical protein
MQLTHNALFAGLLGCFAAGVSAQMPMDDTIRPLLLEAIRKGHAQGEMGGQAREVIVRLFNSTAPIIVIVDRLAPLAVAGCYRLKVTTSQAGVYEFNTKTKERNATPADQKAEYKVNYCANGHFPEEGGGK